MSARRQSSTTSLAKYARTTSPDTSPRSLDFCNAFWGLGDGGVDVLFARMRGAARTMEELRNFWKERYVARARLVPLSLRCALAALTHSRWSSDRRSRKTMRDGSQNWPRCRSEGTRSGVYFVHPRAPSGTRFLITWWYRQGAAQLDRHASSRNRQTSRVPFTTRAADPHRPGRPGRRLRIQTTTP